MDIHQLIRERREELKLSQEDLAQAIGDVSRTAVQSWERPESDPRSTAPHRRRLPAVARALELPLEIVKAALAHDPLSMRVAQPVSEYRATVIPPKVLWGDLMKLHDLPNVFSVEAPDDALLPVLRAGQTVQLTRHIEP